VIKNKLVTLFFLLIPFIAVGESGVILDEGTSYDLYLGAELKTTVLTEHLALLPGVKAGTGIDNFRIGAAFYGLANNTSREHRFKGLDFKMGYGGITFGYIAKPIEMLNLYFESLFGFGSMSYRKPSMTSLTEEDSIAIFEPSINAEINMTESLILSFGTSYRIHFLHNSEIIRESDVNFISGNISLILHNF